MSKLKDYIKKEPLAKKLVRKPRMMKCFFKIYNESCPVCKARFVRNPDKFRLEMFCKECREKLQPTFEKMERLANK